MDLVKRSDVALNRFWDGHEEVFVLKCRNNSYLWFWWNLYLILGCLDVFYKNKNNR